MYNKWHMALICSYFKLISSIAPSLAVISAYRLFHYPVNTTRKHYNEQPLPEAEKFDIPLYNGVILQGYQWGDPQAPVILLVHGWSTTSRSMSHFTYHLLKQRYCVITYDALRHGKTQAGLSDLADWADSVDAVLKKIGPVHAVIAHSFGAAAVTVASKHKLEADSLVFVAPIFDVVSVSDHFAKRLCIPSKIVTAMREHTWEKNKSGFTHYGKNWYDIFQSDFHVPTLIFHDAQDREIGIEHSLALCRQWPWAKLLKTKGLGHRKILDSKEVIEETIRFIDHTLS